MVRERIAETAPEPERERLRRDHVVLAIRRALNIGRCSDYLIGKMTKNNFGRDKSWGKQMGYSTGEAGDVADGAGLTTYGRFAGIDDGPEMLFFNDPEKHPELFEAEVRADAVHLAPAGTAHFSKALGERLVQRLNSPQ